jgi:glycosyltransferase involved in cell wall biosynthesis
MKPRCDEKSRLLYSRGLNILCVVESFDGQATEAWLRRVVETSFRRGKPYEWTFFCTLPGEGKHDEEVGRLGAKVLHAPVPLALTARFAISLRQALKENRCDVLHCHHDVMSGLYLLASAGLPIRKRIVHVHNTSLALPTPNRIKARVASAVFRRACLCLADNIVGVSRDALDALTRGRASRGRRDLVISGGVDTRLFRDCATENRQEIRRGLGLAPDELAMLFVGRLVESKNPGFCLKVLQQLKLQGVNASLLFVGSGSLESALEEEARSLGLFDKVRLLGWRDDVAGIMFAADVLLWTALESQKEGLGLVVVEAQAAGLPIVASRSLPEEAVVIPKMVHFLDLSKGPETWANAVRQAMAAECPSREECLARIEASPCSLEASATALFNLYDEAEV